MSTIISVYGSMILDSRGNPTVEVEVVTDTGAFGRSLFRVVLVQENT